MRKKLFGFFLLLCSGISVVLYNYTINKEENIFYKIQAAFFEKKPIEKKKIAEKNKEEKIQILIHKKQEEEEKKKSQEKTTAQTNKQQEQFEKLKKNLAVKGMILKGNMYFEEEDYKMAISKYIKAYKENPDSLELNSQFAEAYYHMKLFSSANPYYQKAARYEKVNKTHALKSILNAMGETDDLEKVIISMAPFEPSNKDRLYYNTAALCIKNTPECIKTFENYFQERETAQKNNIEIPDLGEDLQNIQTALNNYKNFKQDDPKLQKAYLSGAFFQNGLHKVALIIAQGVLKEHPSYQSMLKIAAKSAYELGDYHLAKNYLENYKKIDTNDPNIIYFLARIHERLKKYDTAIIYFKSAQKKGYEHQADISRRLIYLYNKLGNQDSMLAEFDTLLGTNQGKTTEEDYNLAIYYNIVKQKLAKAKKINIVAKQKFPKSDLFYGYAGWIDLQNDYLDTKQIKQIEKDIKEGLKINRRNPVLWINQGMLAFREGNYQSSQIYFINASNFDVRGEYKSFIKSWLSKLENSNYE